MAILRLLKVAPAAVVLTAPVQVLAVPAVPAVQAVPVAPPAAPPAAPVVAWVCLVPQVQAIHQVHQVPTAPAVVWGSHHPVVAAVVQVKVKTAVVHLRHRPA